MRGTIWVFVGLIAGAGLGAWLSLAAGFPTQAILPVVLWGTIGIGLIVRLVSALFGHKKPPIKQSVAGATETWESLYLGRHPGTQPADPPAYTTSAPATPGRAQPEAEHLNNPEPC